MFYRKKRQHDILWLIIRIISFDYFRILYATTFTVVKICFSSSSPYPSPSSSSSSSSSFGTNIK
jgi:hypothetical protein